MGLTQAYVLLMRCLDWDGITRVEILTEKEAELRQTLADVAKHYQWPEVLEILENRPDLVNATRPGGRSLYAPLHQAANGGAPNIVIESLLKIGAFRTLRNAESRRREQPLLLSHGQRAVELGYHEISPSTAGSS